MLGSTQKMSFGVQVAAAIGLFLIVVGTCAWRPSAQPGEREKKPARIVSAMTATSQRAAPDATVESGCGSAAPTVDILRGANSPVAVQGLANARSWQVNEWKVREIAPLLAKGLLARDFQRGQDVFSAAHCRDCHQFSGAGGAVGPALSGIANRLSAQEALIEILDPNRNVRPPYTTVAIQTASGKHIVGRVLKATAREIYIQTNVLDPMTIETIKRQNVTELRAQQVSTMPTGLLNAFSQDDILDLLAYLLSEGDKSDAMFQGSTDRIPDLP
jgi:putative heme-binding domain-containing protein